MLIIAVRRQN